MIKYIELPSHDSKGNDTVQPIDFYGMEKVANYGYLPKEAQDVITTIKPQKDKAYLLISAVADECWGNNSNADIFPTQGLSNSTEDWGYKTYLNAHYYHNHKNKDPLKSYGKVIHSIWDEQMGRILVIVEVDLIKDPDTKYAIQNGEVIPTSMGMRVPYDVCRVCHPRWKEFYKIPESDMIRIAKSGDLKEIKEIGRKYGVDLSYITELNAEAFKDEDDGSRKSLGFGPVGIHSAIKKYCPHMRFMRNRMTPSGIIAAVVNLRPKFFDISKVGVNAEKSSFVLEKVANKNNETITTDTEATLYIDKKSGKKQAEEKKADIEKEVEGQVLSDNEKEIRDYVGKKIIHPVIMAERDMPDQHIDRISNYPMSEILSTLLSAGMFPRPREFQRISLIQMGKRDLADKYDREGIVIPDDTDSCEKEIKTTISADNINDNLFDIIKPFLSERSYYRPCLVKRITIVKRANEFPPHLNSYDRPKSVLPGVLASLALVYGASKTKAGKSLVPIVENIKGNPKMWLAAVIGSEIASRLFRYAQQEYDGTEKTAGIRTNMATWVGLPVATYLYAGHVYNKAKTGKPVGKVDKFIAKNPAGVGASAGLIANPHSRKFIRNVLKGVFSKHAEVEAMVKSGMDFNGLDITQYPVEERDMAMASMWDLLYENKEK